MIQFFFLFFLGYFSGYLIREILRRLRPNLSACNIGKRGISGRGWIAGGLLLVGFFFEMPLVVFFAGFTWYESRSQWCIAQSALKIGK